MGQASVIAAWIMLLFKAAGLVACAIVMLCVFWAIRSRSSSQKKDDDLG